MPKARLRQSDIVAWARAHRRRTGRFPTSATGKVQDVPGETWAAIDAALATGNRGLRGGSSLAKLLSKALVPKRRQSRPSLTIAQILNWAKGYHQRHGCYPSHAAGKVQGAPGETWAAIDGALTYGRRGLPGGSSLAQLFNKSFRRSRRQFKPALSVAQVLKWARAHRKETGQWPNVGAGRVLQKPDQHWLRIDCALRAGTRGFPGKSSLAKLLQEKVGRRPGRQLPVLTEKLILAWADAYHRRCGQWPTCDSGPVVGTKNETWRKIDRALSGGFRGLKPGRSLSKFLNERRNMVRQIRLTRRLTVREILEWADEHHRRNGEWPRPNSGRIYDPPYVSWSTISGKLWIGATDAPKRLSLQRLLQRKRGASCRFVTRTTYSTAMIVSWAKQHRNEKGSWPTSRSGVVMGAPEENWTKIDSALKKGGHGHAGGDSLARFLARHVGRRIGHQVSTLTDKSILNRARRHHRIHGRWPSCDTGAVQDAPKERWGTIDKALRLGSRGLKKGRSLSKLLDTIRGASSDGRRKRTLKLNDVALWARAYHRRMGTWPDRYSGRIYDARGETWFEIDEAMQYGWRGLRGAPSLRSFVLRLKKPKALKTRNKR